MSCPLCCYGQQAGRGLCHVLPPTISQLSRQKVRVNCSQLDTNLHWEILPGLQVIKVKSKYSILSDVTLANIIILQYLLGQRLMEVEMYICLSQYPERLYCIIISLLNILFLYLLSCQENVGFVKIRSGI